jgi:hypothetical protein
MYIEIDLRVVPPATVLCEPDDFTSFKMVVREVEHARVPVASLEALAGDRAANPEWQRGLTKMLDYARERGWVDDEGVRVHIDRQP